MSDIEAIYARHSVKKYHNTAISDEHRRALHEEIDDINAISGLNIQLIENEPKVFRTFASAATGLISAHNYFAMVGTKHPDLGRRIGYWGQLLVLRAQQLGLNTNWTGGSRRLGLSSAQVAPGEKLVIVVAVGYGENNGKERDTRPIGDLCSLDNGGDVPEWFMQGMRAAQVAPTGFNRQKFHVTLRDDGKCDARATSIMKLTDVDLGIVMRNFEIGAAPYPVQWVNPVTTENN